MALSCLEMPLQYVAKNRGDPSLRAVVTSEARARETHHRALAISKALFQKKKKKLMKVRQNTSICLLWRVDTDVYPEYLLHLCSAEYRPPEMSSHVRILRA